MENLQKILPVFLPLAIVFSGFFGLKATAIFLTKDQRKDKTPSWKFFQFWLNFIGSILGWTILWIYLPRLIEMIRWANQDTISIIDIITLILSFIGITGYLPAAVVGLVTSIRDLILKVGTH